MWLEVLSVDAKFYGYLDVDFESSVTVVVPT